MLAARVLYKKISLERRVSKRCGRVIPSEYAWGAIFGSSPDGLPVIDKARNADRIWFASYFGGNGMTFASFARAFVEGGVVAPIFSGITESNASSFPDAVRHSIEPFERNPLTDY